jgi:hypothetical protein
MSSKDAAARTDAERTPRQKLGELGTQVVNDKPGAYVVATCGPCVIACLGVDAGDGGPDAFSVASAQVARKYERILHLVIFAEGCSLPVPGERGAVVEVLRSFQDQIAGAAIVIQSVGLTSVVLRSIDNVIALASHAAHPRSAFANVAAAANWLSDKLPKEAEFSAERLQEVARHLQSEFL